MNYDMKAIKITDSENVKHSLHKGKKKSELNFLSCSHTNTFEYHSNVKCVD